MATIDKQRIPVRVASRAEFIAENQKIVAEY
jgi:hypothetical protein